MVAAKLRSMTKDETKPHILLVEDARDIREPLARYLREHGYRATTAQDSAAARKVLKGSAIDLIVLDIMMPSDLLFLFSYKMVGEVMQMAENRGERDPHHSAGAGPRSVLACCSRCSQSAGRRIGALTVFGPWAPCIQ